MLPHVTAPWLASSIPSCALMYLRTASGSSAVDGVPYSAIGMLPSVVTTSASTARVSGMPATAKPVASRRMRVHDGVDVGPVAVDLEVHRQLGRGIAIAGELLSVVVDDHHHVGRHEALRHALRRGDEPRCRRAAR